MSKPKGKFVSCRSAPDSKLTAHKLLCSISPPSSMSSRPPGRNANRRPPRVCISGGTRYDDPLADTACKENEVPMSGPEYTAKAPFGAQAGSTEYPCTI